MSSDEEEEDVEHDGAGGGHEECRVGGGGHGRSILIFLPGPCSGARGWRCRGWMGCRCGCLWW